MPLAVVAARLGWLPSAAVPRLLTRAWLVGWLTLAALALLLLATLVADRDAWVAHSHSMVAGGLLVMS